VVKGIVVLEATTEGFGKLGGSTDYIKEGKG
jgi:hypothetical protein